MKCIYCKTEPNNATTKKELKVCCCYLLHKINDEYIQHHKDREPNKIAIQRSDNE